jgi:hypothetical protein
VSSGPRPLPPARTGPASSLDDTTLVDVLDRVLDRGVVLQGDLLLGVAGVDLIHVGLRLVIRSVDVDPR